VLRVVHGEHGGVVGFERVFTLKSPARRSRTDKHSAVWRVTEDDPDSDLYAESSDADTVISYIVTHSLLDAC
jgi:hypothetical protein